MRVSVVLPARNEQDVISQMVRMLLLVYPGIIQQVIVVDDGSTDKTSELIKNIARKDNRVTILTNGPNHGVGSALRLGLTKVSKYSTHILTMDADFVRNISDLDKFFSEIGNYDGLIGSRYIEKDLLIHYPILKKIANRAFHFLTFVFYGVKTRDLTNNFKLYKKSLYLSLPLIESGFAVNAETGLYAVKLGYNIGEIPVPWFSRTRSMGLSKFKLFSVAPGYIRVLFRASKLHGKKL